MPNYLTGQKNDEINTPLVSNSMHKEIFAAIELRKH